MGAIALEAGVGWRAAEQSRGPSLRTVGKEWQLPEGTKVQFERVPGQVGKRAPAAQSSGVRPGVLDNRPGEIRAGIERLERPIQQALDLSLAQGRMPPHEVLAVEMAVVPVVDPVTVLDPLPEGRLGEWSEYADLHQVEPHRRQFLDARPDRFLGVRFQSDDVEAYRHDPVSPAQLHGFVELLHVASLVQGVQFLLGHALDPDHHPRQSLALPLVEVL